MTTPIRKLGSASADRKSTRLNSSHLGISYAVFCLKKKNLQAAEHVEVAVRCRRLDPEFSADLYDRFDLGAVHFNCFFFNDAAPPEIYPLSLHDVLPICERFCSRLRKGVPRGSSGQPSVVNAMPSRSEEHTSELQSLRHLVCRLLLE